MRLNISNPMFVPRVPAQARLIVAVTETLDVTCPRFTAETLTPWTFLKEKLDFKIVSGTPQACAEGPLDPHA